MPIDGHDIINALLDAKRRGAGSVKLAQLHATLRGDPPCDILADHATRIGQIIQGAYKEERHLKKEVEAWIDSSTGTFYAHEIQRALDIKSRQEQKNLSQILKRLSDECIIQRWGDRNGLYRRLDTDLDEIDLGDETDEQYADEIKVLWPFGLHFLYVTLPKNVIVVAGEADSGKTAFLFNLAQMNMNDHEIHYFNCEMGKAELRTRLLNFGEGLKPWKRVHWYERGENYQDVIRPNAINIIDYLELTDNFWMVAKHLKDIHNKLDQGIAVVALQKNKERTYKDGRTDGELGVGGQKALGKPRLYITMNNGNPHTCKIIKCKNWRRSDQSPNGLVLDYKVVKGSKLLLMNDHIGWYRPDSLAEENARKNRGKGPGYTLNAAKEEEDFVHEE